MSGKFEVLTDAEKTADELINTVCNVMLATPQRCSRCELAKGCTRRNGSDGCALRRALPETERIVDNYHPVVILAANDAADFAAEAERLFEDGYAALSPAMVIRDRGEIRLIVGKPKKGDAE